MSQKLPKRGYFPVRRAVTVSVLYTGVYVTGHTAPYMGHGRIRRVQGKSPYTVIYRYGCRPLGFPSFPPWQTTHVLLHIFGTAQVMDTFRTP